MRTLLIGASLCLLAACNSQPSPAPEPTPSGPATVDLSASSMVGRYEEPGPDGKTVATEIRADGTYSATVEGKPFEDGSWTMKGGNTCFTPSGDKPTERCYSTTQPDADGKFTATNVADAKDTVVVTKLPDEPATENGEDVD